MKITVIKKSNGKVKTMSACPWMLDEPPVAPRASRRGPATLSVPATQGIRDENHGHQEEQRQGQDDDRLPLDSGRAAGRAKALDVANALWRRAADSADNRSATSVLISIGRLRAAMRHHSPQPACARLAVRGAIGHQCRQSRCGSASALPRRAPATGSVRRGRGHQLMTWRAVADHRPDGRPERVASTGRWDDARHDAPADAARTSTFTTARVTPESRAEALRRSVKDRRLAQLRRASRSVTASEPTRHRRQAFRARTRFCSPDLSLTSLVEPDNPTSEPDHFRSSRSTEQHDDRCRRSRSTTGAARHSTRSTSRATRPSGMPGRR